MAYQPKSYRKFLVGAVSTAVVASSFAGVAGAAANFTDVNSNYKEAVDFLVSKGINGISASEFGTYQNIKRVDAAVFVVKALGLDVNAAPASGFTDVPERAVKEVNALKAAGITSGKSATEFGAQDLITRGELAIWLDKAFDLKGEGDVSAFTDANGIYTDAIKALVANNITKGTSATTFGTKDPAKRGDFAKFVFTASQLDVAAEINNVTAINSTTVALSGVGLDKLKVEELTVSNNKVVSVTPSEDGKSATVKLNTQLVDGEEATLTFNEKEFKFTFKLDVDGITVKQATYDDDTKNQYVKVAIGGQEYTGLDLAAAGYDVTFYAYEDKKATTPATIFDSTSATSTSGLLNDILTGYATTTDGKDAYISVTVTKGSTVLTSDLQKITIKNTDLATDAISSYKLFNNDLDLVQTSSTLVVGEDAVISEIKVKAGSDEEKIQKASGLYTVKSSNPAVVAVDSSDVLTAVAPGTATITVSYGKTTKEITLTVKNEERELKQVDVVDEDGQKITSSALAIDSLGTTIGKTIYLKPVDQYGDVLTVKVDSTLNLATSTSDVAKATATIGTVVDNDTDEKDGFYPVALAPIEKGTAYLTVTNGTFKPTINAHKITVSDNATIANYKLELVEVSGDPTYSDDATINIKDDNKVKYALNGYTSEGILASTVTLASGNIDVVQNADIIAAAKDANDDVEVTAGTKTGTATLVVTYNGKKYTQQITVVDEGTELTGVQFKSIASPKYAVTYNYKTALNVNESGNDPIVSGLTFTSTPSQPVRIQKTDGSIYIDKNANGHLDDGVGGTESAIAYLTMEFIPANGTSTGAVTAVDTGIDLGDGTNDEGRLVYVVKDAQSKVIASTSVVVDL